MWSLATRRFFDLPRREMSAIILFHLKVQAASWETARAFHEQSYFKFSMSGSLKLLSKIAFSGPYTRNHGNHF